MIASSPVSRPGPRPRSWHRRVLGLGAGHRVRRRIVGACLLGALAGAAIGLGAVPSTPDAGSQVRPDEAGRATPLTDGEQAALAAFQAQLEPLLANGSQVVALGLRPGVADIGAGTYPPEVLVTMADGWIAELASLRRALEAMDPPAFLASIHARYVESIDGYFKAAVALRSAAGLTDAAERGSMLERAAAAGRAADRRYDEADSALTRLISASDRDEE